MNIRSIIHKVVCCVDTSACGKTYHLTQSHKLTDHCCPADRFGFITHNLSSTFFHKCNKNSTK